MSLLHDVTGALSGTRGALVQQLARRRAMVQATIDACAWTVALAAATLLRYDFDYGQVHPAGVAVMIPLAVEAQVISGYVFGLYRGRWRFGSFDEVQALAKAVLLTTTLVFCLDFVLVDERAIPLSSAVASGPVALVLMAGARYCWRLRLEQRRRPTGLDGSRLLVFGAGEGGAQVLGAMLRDPRSPYYPVGLLDDDAAKRDLRIMGVRVLGGRRHLGAAAEKYQAEALLIAIPSADAQLVGELTDLAEEAGLEVKVLPPVHDLFAGDVRLADIRDIDVKDFLGRHQVETNLDSIAGYVTGRRVLVTGAGGSVGSELCRQVSRFAPASLVMVDRSEAGLHGVELSLEGRALLDSDNLVLADICDSEHLGQIFRRHRPQVVFHAAALKHLPLLERAPGEAVKTNLWGTLEVLECAAEWGVERFVNISTDKAADPVSVLGYSKRIAERLTAHFASTGSGTYLSVRFGNVLGSSGSVLTTFQAQVKAGGPLTVTDPRVTRYFMTVEEAIELVIQAGAIGRPGEVLVLDMGEPVRIAEVAERVAARAKRPTRIIYTGLRPGEKLEEALLGRDEVDRRPIHPAISHVPVPPLDPVQVRMLDPTLERQRVIDDLRELCGPPCARPDRTEHPAGPRRPEERRAARR